MDIFGRYALLRLISSVKRVDSRKRLQKSVFLLQASGCDIGADYFLHFYGPYSRDVAEELDLLAQSDWVEETRAPHRMGETYSYKITSSGKAALAACESTLEGKRAKKKIKPYIPGFIELRDEPLWTLELASTIAYYRTSGGVSTWVRAKQKAAKFKRVRKNASVLREAFDLAKRFAPGAR